MRFTGMKIYFGLAAALLLAGAVDAQMITGVWKGKAGNGLRAQRMELKLIQQGDSLVGTVYYHQGLGSYRRYAVTGYFDSRTNAVRWRDEAMVAERNSWFLSGEGTHTPQVAVADFNCPGANIMLLEGTLNDRELKLSKADRPQFRDEWDFIIDNYLTGGNDPQLIDSVRRIAAAPPPTLPATPVANNMPKPTPPADTKPTAPPTQPTVAVTTPAPAAPAQPPVATKPTEAAQPPAVTPPAPTNSTTALVEKFKQRKQVPVTELLLAGDTIEVHFYDNAEIDGDSISVFMNGQLTASNIRLSDKPFILKWAVAELNETNELVMVAENMGSIPPNTSYMIAWINGQRYTAQLESTEQTSAMIRLVKGR